MRDHAGIYRMLIIIAIAGFWAGLQNALAGGGSFVTLPVLMLAGLSPLAANITSTVALFPGQVSTGLSGRHRVGGVAGLSFLILMLVSLIGGALGGWLLLKTPSTIFARMVPWLVLFATLVFIWGSYFRKENTGQPSLGPIATLVSQSIIAVYGGYFGGGIGFLMLAALMMGGMSIRQAGATKNALASVIGLTAVIVLVNSPLMHWREALILGAGSVVGGLCGAWALHRVDERILRMWVVALGVALTLGLFLRPISG
jgi:uncharacterized membrane protein YfcA